MLGGRTSPDEVDIDGNANLCNQVLMENIHPRVSSTIRAKPKVDGTKVKHNRDPKCLQQEVNLRTKKLG